MPKHINIDWPSIVGYRVTEGILNYINQIAQQASELLSKRITLDNSSNVNKTGIFIKPGILADTLTSNVLMPSIVYSGLPGVFLRITSGKAVTYKGQVIELDTTLSIHYDNPNELLGKTIVLRYVSQDSDESEAQTYHPVTGVTAIPVKMKSFTVELVENYDPTADEYLNSLGSPFDGDYVPIGKVDDTNYNVAIVEGGYRRIALVSIPWLGFKDSSGWGHYVGEFDPIVDFEDGRDTKNIYHFLACKGSQDRTTNNPLGLTPEDIGFNWSHLYISHGSGFSEWPTSSLEVSYPGSGTSFNINGIEDGVWVYLVSHDKYIILDSTDPIPSSYDVSTLPTGHYYLLILCYNTSATFEALDLGTNQITAVSALMSLYTSRHKVTSDSDSGWIGLAVFYRSPFAPGIVLTGPLFSSNVWLKTASGEHDWNGYRKFQATTTSTTDVVHDGKAITPYNFAYSSEAWWQPGSKLLRDIVDYLFENSLFETDFNTHKNIRCNGSISSVNAPPETNAQHWASVIRLPGTSSPQYFSNLYYTGEWNQQCSRSVERLISKLSDLRALRRIDQRYESNQAPGMGTIKGGVVLTPLPYAYWASQIEIEDTLNRDLENQYMLNTFHNNNYILKNSSFEILGNIKDSDTIIRNENITYISQIPGTNYFILVRLEANLSGGTLSSFDAYFWVKTNIENVDWGTPDVVISNIDITDLSSFIRFQPDGKICWYEVGGRRFFYINWSAIGYSSSNTHFDNGVLGFELVSMNPVSISKIGTGSLIEYISSATSVDRRANVTTTSLLILNNNLYYFSKSTHACYDIRPIQNDGSLGTGYTSDIPVLSGEFYHSSSWFYDNVSNKIILALVTEYNANMYLRLFYWNGSNLVEYTPDPSGRNLRLSSASSGISYAIYANQYGLYVSRLYHVSGDSTYGIAYIQNYANSLFTAFWRRNDNLPLPQISQIPGGTSNLVVMSTWQNNAANVMPIERSSKYIPNSRVDLIGGALANIDFCNPVILPTTDRGWTGLFSIHMPSWTIINCSSDEVPYLDVQDYTFLATGWHPADDKLRLVAFRIRAWSE